MPTPRKAVPFKRPFTTAALPSFGLTPGVLRGWLARGEVLQIADGVYAPAWQTDLNRWRAICTSRGITDGIQCASIRGAAALHGICTPVRLPNLHDVPPRPRDLVDVPLVRINGFLAPARIHTALELASAQSLSGALIPIECVLRNGVTQAEFAQLHDAPRARRQRPGSAALASAVHHMSGKSGSALESYSRGLMIEAGLPKPEQQVAFTIQGHRYYVDFFWRQFGIIGEADGECKFDEGARAQFAQHRRQARLQTLGLTVVRWGWPELDPDPTPWLDGLRRILR